MGTVMENGEKCQQRISPLTENGEKCQQRISPLRGGMTQPEIVSNTKVLRNGLHALRDDHYTILANIRDEYENQKIIVITIPKRPRPPPTPRALVLLPQVLLMASPLACSLPAVFSKLESPTSPGPSSSWKWV